MLASTNVVSYHKTMRNYAIIFTNFVLIIFFVLADLALYYYHAKGHSKVPFIVSLIITVPATILVLMATYQTYHHRNDKEAW